MISVVGIGLDGIAGLSLRAQSVVAQATVLAGGQRHLGYFPEHPALRLTLKNLSQSLTKLEQLNSSSQQVVVLATGDPLFFGLGRLLLARFGTEQLQFFPHVSSIQLAFSHLRTPWQDAQVVSLHGRDSDQLWRLLRQGSGKIAVLTDSHHHPGALAQAYLASQAVSRYSFHIGENLGSPQEKFHHFLPEQLPQLAQLNHTDFSPLNVLVLLRQYSPPELSKLPLIGLPDSSFFSFEDRPNLITKREIRLAILGELALQQEQKVWDIGAGTGSVSIEIARLCPTSQVWAIEQTAMGSTLIEQNSRRFQVDNIINVNGQAPFVLQDLPQPERIFLGGSGGQLTEILAVCQHKLMAGGIMVMAFATIEHQQEALAWLKLNNWYYRLLQLQISRSIPLNHLTRWNPLNPVTLITAIKNQPHQIP